MYVHNYIRDCTISLTQACNMNCPYCFRNSGVKDSLEELSLEQWQSAFLKLSRAHVFRVLLTGGEVFTRDDLPEILKELFSRHFQISLATNGTICNDRVLDCLSQHKDMVGYVQVSLDGDCSEINDITRGKGSFEKTAKFIGELQKRNIHVSCRITLSKHNVLYFRRIYHYISCELGIKDISINEIQSVGRGIASNDILLTKEQRIRLIEENRDLVDRLNFMNCEIARLIRMISGKQDIVGGKLQTCTKAFKGIHILQNGDIVLCDMLPNIKLGNILKVDDLLDIWKHGELINQIRERNSISLMQYAKCEQCEFISICTGSCPVFDYESDHNIVSNNDKRCFLYLKKDYEEFLLKNKYECASV